jgi:diacylglycerol kinase
MNKFITGRVPAFKNAFAGFKYVVVSQKNAWIHALATLAAILLGFLLKISFLEWSVIVVVVGFVWTAEIFNTAIEAMVDIISPGYHPFAKIAKDAGAAGVLVVSITAAAVGLLLFLPRIIALLQF